MATYNFNDAIVSVKEPSFSEFVDGNGTSIQGNFTSYSFTSTDKGNGSWSVVGSGELKDPNFSPKSGAFAKFKVTVDGKDTTATISGTYSSGEPVNPGIDPTVVEKAILDGQRLIQSTISLQSALRKENRQLDRAAKLLERYESRKQALLERLSALEDNSENLLSLYAIDLEKAIEERIKKETEAAAISKSLSTVFKSVDVEKQPELKDEKDRMQKINDLVVSLRSDIKTIPSVVNNEKFLPISDRFGTPSEYSWSKTDTGGADYTEDFLNSLGNSKIVDGLGNVVAKAGSFKITWTAKNLDDLQIVLDKDLGKEVLSLSTENGAIIRISFGSWNKEKFFSVSKESSGDTRVPLGDYTSKSGI